MGNCLQKPVTWVDDDDWEMAEESPHRSPQSRKKKKTTPSSTTTTRDDSVDDGGGGTTTSTEVKIKISKKQLEKVLQQAGAGDGKGMQLEQVLVDLVNMGHVVYRAQEQEGADRHWRPKLASIPEIAE